MSAGGIGKNAETYEDQLLGFTLPGRDARGRVVRLGPVLDAVLSAHAYPPLIRDLLAQALVLTALIGGLLKEEGSQLTLQVQSEAAAINLLVCDFRGGELRGYIRHDADRLTELGADPSLVGLFGLASLAITFDLATSRQRYQGIVPLEGATLAAACQSYFAQSEQVPTLIRVGIGEVNGQVLAGGLLVQHLAEGEDGRARLHAQMDHSQWEHVAALAGSTQVDELIDPALSLESLVWRLFHEERDVHVLAGARLARGCRCTIEHYRSVLARFPEQERDAMRDADGLISVDCAFCSKILPIPL